MHKELEQWREIENRQYILESPVPGIYEINLPVYKDERGYFQEILRFPEVKEITGIDFSQGQWNESLSEPGVIRAIHAESQAKLIRPLTGHIFIALVDLRPDSKTFLDHTTIEYDASEKRRTFFLPEGIGNSICVLGEEPVLYQYIVSTLYKDTKTLTIRYDDPDIGINWPIKNPIMSERDRDALNVRDVFLEKATNG